MRMHSKIYALLRQTFALLLLDQGWVFVMQGISIFATGLLGKLTNNLAISFVLTQILTNSAIVYRLYMLQQGNRPPILACYLQSFQQTPKLLLALLCCGIMLLPILFMLQLNLLPVLRAVLFICLTMAMIYVTYFLSILIIAHKFTPLVAILENYRLMRTHISPKILLFITVLYNLALLGSINFAAAMPFLMIIWHGLCVIIYATKIKKSL